MGKTQIFKNISYSFCANLVSFFTSILIVMFVPKYLSVYEYGQLQLFLFYTTYLGVFTFGWRDGIYLRYAGKTFETLDNKVFSGQIYSYTMFMIVMSFLIIVIDNVFVLDPIKREIIYCVAVILPFFNIEGLSSSILQMTNRIRQYACLIGIERGALLLVIFFVIIIGESNFQSMYIAYFNAFFIASIFGVLSCRNLFTTHIPCIKRIFVEAFENIRVGIKLLTANIVGFLIIGIVRFGISEGWDVPTFGKVSLTLSISNFFMVFIDSVSVVLFPIIKHIDLDKMSALYTKGKLALSIAIFGILMCYYPVKWILTFWLPQYENSLAYMALLFPVCVYESKFSLLINIYLKALRKEGLLLKINVKSIIVSCLITGVVVYFLHDLRLAISSVVFLYAFRCELAEFYLARILGINVLKDMIADGFIVLSFMISGYFIDNWFCMLIYGSIYFLYVVLYRKQVSSLLTGFQQYKY